MTSTTAELKVSNMDTPYQYSEPLYFMGSTQTLAAPASSTAAQVMRAPVAYTTQQFYVTQQQFPRVGVSYAEYAQRFNHLYANKMFQPVIGPRQNKYA